MTRPDWIHTAPFHGPVTVWQAWDDRMGADCSPCGTGATEVKHEG